MTLEQIKRLDGVKEGKRIYVGFHQNGVTVAFVEGRWVPRDPPRAYSFQVRGNGARSRAFILPTDSVHIVGNRAVQGIRVDLAGRRIPHSRNNAALLNDGHIHAKGGTP